MAKKGQIQRKWYVVDASGRVLGRLAARVATVLMGKHKPTYTPHVDVGDFVVVINAAQVALTGRKAEQKTYFHHTQHSRGARHIPFSRMIERHPERVIELAVRRMLPKTKLGDKMYSKLKVYAGSEHPHAAQKPEPLTL